MDCRANYLLDVADLVREAAAMNDAALALYFDEVRFRSQVITAKADDLRHVDLAIAAAHLVVILSPLGTAPSPGYRGGMLGAANKLDAPGFDPLSTATDGHSLIVHSTLESKPNAEVLPRAGIRNKCVARRWRPPLSPSPCISAREVTNRVSRNVDPDRLVVVGIVIFRNEAGSVERLF